MTSGMYRRCRLRRKNVERIVDLPAAVAVPGNRVILRDENGNPVDGWFIQHAGLERPASALGISEKDYVRMLLYGNEVAYS